MKQKTISISKEKINGLLPKLAELCTNKNQHAQFLISTELYKEFLKDDSHTGLLEVEDYCVGWLRITVYHFGSYLNDYDAKSKRCDILVSFELK